MIRGAVYPIDLGQEKRGHEQRGNRFGLVVSIQQNHGTVVTVIPTSTSAQSAIYRPEFEIAGEMTKLLVDQIRTIDVDYVTGDPIAFLGTYEMQIVEQTLSRYLGL